MKVVVRAIGSIAIFILFSAGYVQAAAEMNDYCVVPPFIQENAKPNLLMIVDNSASMYDLAYVDKGKRHCSVSTSKTCFIDYDCSYCSGDSSKKCSTATDCSAGQTCNTTETCPITNVDRQPLYCFDETFLSSNVYVGYFANKTSAGATQYYNYDFTNQKFVEGNSISCTAGGQNLKEIPGQMCLVYNNLSPFTVTEFRASGSYLNWLTASKFDVEKNVLTGGKWDGTFLLPESRGCVGQRYIKKTLTKHCSNSPTTHCTSDAVCGTGKCEEFTNYNSSVSDPNPSLGVSFGIRGEADPVNKSAPSPGGQTYIDIFKGNYHQEQCQPAIDAISTANSSQTDWRNSIQDCINYGATGSYCYGDSSRTGCTSDSECEFIFPNTGSKGVCKKNNGTASTDECFYNTDCPNSYPNCIGAVAPIVIKHSPCVIPAQPPEVKTKIALIETVQTCWSYTRNGNLGTGDVARLTSGGKCDDIYKNYGVCSLNNNKTCNAATPCGSGEGTCSMGPTAILPGNPAYICSPGYLGQFYVGTSPTWNNTWLINTKHCFDDSTNTIGVACTTDSSVCTGSYSCQDDSVVSYRRFCNTFNAPNTIDPSDSPSTTSTSDNLPALISSIGIEGQLGLPIATLKVRIAKNAAPAGLVQEYDGKIRMGVMTFNYNGAYSESGTTYGTSIAIAPQKVCSNSLEKSCISDFDCPTQAAGLCVAAGTNIKDGAKVIAEVGKGKCADSSTNILTATDCATQAHCSSTQYCKSNGVGTHLASGSLVKSIDEIVAKSWTPFSEAFYNAIGYFAQDSSQPGNSRTALRINSGDYPDSLNPSEYQCQSNNILLITDGMSTADRKDSVNNLATLYGAGYSGGTQGWEGLTCSLPFAGSVNLDDLAWIGRNKNIKEFNITGSASSERPQKKSEYINSYVVFNGADNGQTGECNNTTILNQTASKGGTTLLKTELPEQYESTLRKAFAAVAGGTASGTAASILSNSEGSGANILQAVFYPYKEFESTTDAVSGAKTPTNTTWIGELQNLWYYVDPYVGNSSVREDTGYVSGDHTMNIVNDYQVEFFFDTKSSDTRARLKKDANADGMGEVSVTKSMDSRVKDQGFCSVTTTRACSDTAPCPGTEDCVSESYVSADDVGSIWRAGKLLWQRDVTTVAGKRKLYTYLKGSQAGGKTFATDGLIDLVSGFDALPPDDKFIIQTYLQAASLDDAKNIIKYAQGDDSAVISGITTKRNRKVKITSGGSTITREWKLGDIVSSTPRVQSSGKLNNYHLDPPSGYGDYTYANDSSKSGYANSDAYKSRGMVYTGANDGMLHAFKMGTLAVKSQGNQLATLSGDGLGEEQWSFIPKNVLPYLKYLADASYSHQYLVDGTTKIADASIGYNDADTANFPGCTESAYWNCKRDDATSNNKSWRSILIGSMGVGGASRNSGDSCVDKNSTMGVCVKAPLIGDGVSSVGLSSYFALDITDPNNPTFLWEFSDESLGYSTSGAAISRINTKIVKADGTVEKNTNGRWYAVFGNGPSGPIDTTTHQFKGKSDKPLKVFVLDLKLGSALKEELSPSTTIENAFVGSMSSAPVDTDRWNRIAPGFYSDDALYFGYTNCAGNCTTSAPTWNGGIMRLRTFENPLPSTWSLTPMITNTGPVTSSIARLQDKKYHNLWIFFGSGRYFYKDDDKSASRKLFGVKDPCYRADNTLDNSAGAACAATAMDFTASGSGFADQTSAVNSVVNGWSINLDAEDTTNVLGAERVITDPVAMPNGAVFFTTFKPSTDICQYGGNSYMWGVKYDTGGTATPNTLKGKALVQVSTGSFEEIDVSKALTESLDRKMGTPMVGKPPTDPPPIVSSSMHAPLKKIIHIQER